MSILPDHYQILEYTEKDAIPYLHSSVYHFGMRKQTTEKRNRLRKVRVNTATLLSLERFKREYNLRISKPTEPPAEEKEKIPEAPSPAAIPQRAEVSAPQKSEATVEPEKAPEKVPPKQERKVETVPERKFSKKEWIMVGIMILIVSLFSLFGNLGWYESGATISLGGYDFSKDWLYWSFLVSLGLVPGFILISFIFNPAGVKPVFRRSLHVFSWLFFSVCGIPAYMVIATILGQFLHCPVMLSHYVAAVLTLLYEYLIIKLYAYDKLEAKFIGWELFRFALVGVVAAITDFLCTTATRAACNATGLADLANGSLYVTLIAVTVGFAAGVVVNYILSVYMVYKASTKSTAGKWWGVLLFIALSAVGWLIGIGIEYWLYNLWSWTYILVFIIRTLVVLIWNYLSRKLILFK